MEVHPMLEEGGTAGASNPRADGVIVPGFERREIVFSQISRLYGNNYSLNTFI
jgi:hypothetical protein